MKFIPKQKPRQAMGEQEYEPVAFAPQTMEERQICPHCEAVFTEPLDYCPICGMGKNILQAGRLAGMRYYAIRLNENGKALICPHCENEELTPGDFCMICGNDIVNRCADTPDPKRPSNIVGSCGTILTGNARYCSRCGNEGTFFQKGWLRDWKSENTKKAIRNVNVAIDLSEVREENG